MLCIIGQKYVSEERARFMNLNVGPLGGGICFINCYLQTDVVSGSLFKTHQNVWLAVTLWAVMNLQCVLLTGSKTRPFLGVCNLIIIGFLQLSNHSSNHVNSTIRSTSTSGAKSKQMLSENPIKHQEVPVLHHYLLFLLWLSGLYWYDLRLPLSQLTCQLLCSQLNYLNHLHAAPVFICTDCAYH